MKVETLMVTDVATCRPEDSAAAAAKIMWDRDCGAVPVVEDGARVVGMVTDRDLCIAAHLEAKPLIAIPVRRAMSREVFSCRRHDDLFEAEAIMRVHQIRRLPVTDVNGVLKGILSLSDFAKEATKEAFSRRRRIEVSYTDVGLMLGEINWPNRRARARQAS